MSVISTAYDAIVSEVQGLLTSHNRLSNPYTVEKNPEPALNKGWGIRVGGAVNQQLELGCNYSVERDVVIIITRKFYAQELNTTGRASVEKDLMGDQDLLLNELEQDPQVNNTNGVIKFVFESDNGIEFVFVGETGNYIKIESLFKLKYVRTFS